MPALVGTMLSHFCNRLAALERVRDLSDWERKFVEDMRERFDTRDRDSDLGVQQWNPSRKQWNQLSTIAADYGIF